MYLSRLTLAEGAVDDPRFASAFESAYGLHRSVWSLFGDGPARQRDFLYRLDDLHGRPKLWTLSERQPAPSSLWFVESKEVRPLLQHGDLLEFELRVNPVVTRDGKRHDVVMDRKVQSGWRDRPVDEREPQATLVQAALADWFEARAEGLGVRVHRLLAESYEVSRFAKPNGKKVQLGICDLTGILEVIDPDRFLASWSQGIGPAKGFGCGLMLIRRAQR